MQRRDFRPVNATRANGEWFGDRELREFFGSASEPGASRFATALLEHLEHWSGRGTPGQPFDDDLTIVVVDATVSKPERLEAAVHTEAGGPVRRPVALTAD